MARRATRRTAASAAGVLLAAALLTLAGPAFTRTAAARTAAARTVPAADRNWTATWGASPQKPAQPGFDDVTLRLIIHTTIGGRAARIRLSNEFGSQPLQIGDATVGVETAGAAVDPRTLRELTFNGGQAVATIAPGAQLTSDAVPEDVPAQADLAVSLYLPGPTGPPTEHADFGEAHQTSYISAAGNHAGDAGPDQYPATMTSWFFLDGVDVWAPGTGAVVALGDSITDGTHSTDNTNHRYPDWLAGRLQAAGGPYRRLAVVNAGIGGNELLQTSACCGASPSALARLDTDVLDQPGVKDVIVLLGTNDILGAHHATATAIIDGLRQLADRIRARGLRVFGGTITPSGQFTAAEETERETVNQWITTSRAFDGVEDFAGAIADPGNPAEIIPAYDSGDHLHPNDAGYQAMADAVNLKALIPNG